MTAREVFPFFFFVFFVAARDYSQSSKNYHQNGKLLWYRMERGGAENGFFLVRNAHSQKYSNTIEMQLVFLRPRFRIEIKNRILESFMRIRSWRKPNKWREKKKNFSSNVYLIKIFVLFSFTSSQPTIAKNGLPTITTSALTGRRTKKLQVEQYKCNSTERFDRIRRKYRERIGTTKTCHRSAFRYT